MHHILGVKFIFLKPYNLQPINYESSSTNIRIHYYECNHIVCTSIYEVIITLFINTMNMSQSYCSKWLTMKCGYLPLYFWHSTFHVSLYHALAQFFGFQLGKVWCNLTVNLSIVKKWMGNLSTLHMIPCIERGQNVDRYELSFWVYLIKKDPRMVLVQSSSDIVTCYSKMCCSIDQ